MATTIPLFVNLSATAKNSLVQGFSLISRPATPEFVLRDTVRIEVRFMTVTAGSRSGVLADIGETATLRFGTRVKAGFTTALTYTFFTAAFTRVVVTEGEETTDIYYYATLSLNTAEFIAAFTGNESSVALISELEVETDGNIQTVAQFDSSGLFDVIRSGTPGPVPAVPPYPTAPTALALLGGSTDGTAWKFYTVPDLWALILKRRTSSAGAESTSLAKVVTTAEMVGVTLLVQGASETYPSFCYSEAWTCYEDDTEPANVAGESQLCLGYDSATKPYVWKKAGIT